MVVRVDRDEIESRLLWFGHDYPAGIVTDLHHPVSFSQEVQLIVDRIQPAQSQEMDPVHGED